MKTTSKLIELVLTLGLLAASGLVYALFLAPQPSASVQAQAKSSYETSPVTRGDIARQASGSGSLVPSQSSGLGFNGSGTVAELNVQVGDTVKAGQVLAVLDTLPSLKQAVANQQLALLKAQKALDDLKTGAPANLAQTLADQSSAEAALTAAKNALRNPHDWRCPDETTAKYYQQYLEALVAAKPWQYRLAHDEPSDKAYAQMNLKPILRKMELAYLNYQYCQAYTPQEIAHTQADLLSAQANLAQAQRVYKNLQANQGIDPLELAIAEARLKVAQVQLNNAQSSLDGATLKAPYDGKITAVTTAVGQQPATGAILTIAQVDPLQIQANIDESDLTNIGLGCPVSATFTPRPNQPVSGTVAQITPSLVTVNNVKVIQLLIDLNKEALSSTPLPIGTSATLQITCAQAQNALLAPLQAIHEAGDHTNFVYVLNAQGLPEKRAVEVGIQSSVAAEIKSGLKAGEQVITSAVNLP